MGKHIIIIPGHTNASPGCYCVSPIGKHEHFAMLDFCQALSVILMNSFQATIVFRDGKTIDETYLAVHRMEPDAVIECHVNSFTDPKVAGSEVLCSQLNKMFAGCIHQAQVRALGRTGKTDRGVIILDSPRDRGFHNTTALDGTLIPNCLIEPFFGSNATDCRLYLDKQKTLCEEISLALVQYFRGRLSQPQ